VELNVELMPGRGVKNFTKNYVSTLHRSQIENTLNVIERLKTTIGFVLQEDIL